MRCGRCDSAMVREKGTWLCVACEDGGLIPRDEEQAAREAVVLQNQLVVDEMVRENARLKAEVQGLRSQVDLLGGVIEVFKAAHSEVLGALILAVRQLVPAPLIIPKSEDRPKDESKPYGPPAGSTFLTD